jgi:hypothetical protein
VQPPPINKYYNRKGKKSMNKKEPLLKDILQDLIRAAEFSRGNKQMIRLSRGLEILIVCFGHDYHLEISRDNCQPGNNEWEIILKNIPQLEYKTPIINKIDGRYYFTAVLNKKGFQSAGTSQPISNPELFYHV